MRYELFQRMGEVRWRLFDEQLTQLERGQSMSHEALEKLTVSFRVVLHDYAFSRGRFPGTAATEHLRSLAVRGNRALRLDDRAKGRLNPFRFYAKRFPELFRRHLEELTVAAALFIACTCLGLAVAALDPGAAQAFVGEEAIQGLQDDVLWTDEASEMGPLMGAQIARNNVGVSIRAWLGGLLAGLGSLYILAVNGVMFGSVLSLTWHYGMLDRLLDFIAAHGPLELSLIVVAGAAGLRVGRAMVSSGLRPRAQRLMEAGQESFFLVLGMVPFFLLLAAVENFISPSQMTFSLKVAVGVGLWLVFFAMALRFLWQGSPVGEQRR